MFPQFTAELGVEGTSNKGEATTWKQGARQTDHQTDQLKLNFDQN
jgi:hypothetical protein